MNLSKLCDEFSFHIILNKMQTPLNYKIHPIYYMLRAQINTVSSVNTRRNQKLVMRPFEDLTIWDHMLTRHLVSWFVPRSSKERTETWMLSPVVWKRERIIMLSLIRVISTAVTQCQMSLRCVLGIL